MNKNYISYRGFPRFKTLLVFVSLLCFSYINAQQTYTFTNCNNVGPNGPTQAQATAAYLSTNLNGSVQVTGGVQSFTVPFTGPYRITCIGAAGGTQSYSPGYPGGLGASMRGDFTFTIGTVLRIIVGQKGEDTRVASEDNAAPGGGGGSFVYFAATNPFPLIAAGGGGGGGRTTNSPNATITQTANSALSPGGVGGVNGNGGGVNTTSSSYWAGGGAGWLTDGTGGNNTSAYSYLPGSNGAGGGRTPANGAIGGTRYNDGLDEGGDGGFGGGGGGGSDNMGTGGGGGFSGGGGAPGGGNNNTGGGGGSYNSGTNQVNIASANTGHGRVIIEELCFISLTAAGPNGTNPAICAGNSITLTTNAASNYTWSNNNTTTTSIVVSPNVTTTYSITGTSTANCQSSSFITVTVSPGVPVLSISNPSNNICLGRTVSLTASGALTYTWANPGVVNGNTFAPTSTQVYTVSGQNGCGITTATTSIVVAPLPVSTLASPTLICEGYPSTLTAVSSVGGYTWQPGPQTGATVVVAPMANQVYTVSASDGTCSGTATVLVTTKTTPTITASSTSTRVCEGQSVTLTANGAGIGGTYSWTPAGGTNTTVTLAPASNSLFVVYGTNSLNCTAQANQVVVVDQAPPLNVTANKTLVCTGDAVNLNATGAQTYNWVSGPSTAGYTVNPTSAITIYTVNGSHSTNSCVATRTIAIAAIIPNVNVTTTMAVCDGGTATLTATGATSYTWNNIGVGASGVLPVQPLTTSVYSLIANTQSLSVNCITNHTAQVFVYPNPTITVTPGKNTICKGETHTLTASGASTYSWNTAATTSVITVKPTSTTIYTVTGTDNNNCSTTIIYQAKVNNCTGITQVETHQVSMYPNPSTGEVFLSSDAPVTLRLVNSIGQEIRSITLNETNGFQLRVKDLSNGVYFLVGENEYGAVNQKLVVSK